MNKLFLTESKRQLVLPETWIAFGIGIFLTTWQLYASRQQCGYFVQYVYKRWFASTDFFTQTFWFYLIFPLLSTLPIIFSYAKDNRKGYINQLIIRTGRKDYIKFKGLHIFIIPFLIVTIPLILNFIAWSCFCPLTTPDPIDGIGPYGVTFFSEFCYEHAFLYTISGIILDGIFAGAIGLWTCALYNYCKSPIEAALIPFLIHYILFTLGNMFNINHLMPNVFLCPGRGFYSIYSFLFYIIITFTSMFAWKRSFKFNGILS